MKRAPVDEYTWVQLGAPVGAAATLSMSPCACAYDIHYTLERPWLRTETHTHTHTRLEKK